MWRDFDDDDNDKNELFCGMVDHRNKNKEGITATESLSNLIISIDFISHLKPRRAEFLKYVFKNILLT